jgi:hypothetical protein
MPQHLTQIPIFRIGDAHARKAFEILSCFGIPDCNLLHTRVLVQPYDDHVRLLSREPWFGDRPQVYSAGEEPTLL